MHDSENNSGIKHQANPAPVPPATRGMPSTQLDLDDLEVDLDELEARMLAEEGGKPAAESAVVETSTAESSAAEAFAAEGPAAEGIAAGAAAESIDAVAQAEQINFSPDPTAVDLSNLDDPTDVRQALLELAPREMQLVPVERLKPESVGDAGEDSESDDDDMPILIEPIGLRLLELDESEADEAEELPILIEPIGNGQEHAEPVRKKVAPGAESETPAIAARTAGGHEAMGIAQVALPIPGLVIPPPVVKPVVAEPGVEMSFAPDPNTPPAADVRPPMPSVIVPLDDTADGQKRITADPQMGGIEILVSMAEKNEIDPKNIDIIDVCDRFLKAIAAAPKENLRQSGKIIFHASVLLRMKAEALLISKIEELDFDGLGDDYLEFDENGLPLNYDNFLEPIARQITLQDLERALVRQTKTRNMRHRRVTLEQLILALRDAEKIDETKATERRIKARIDLEGHHDMRDMDDLLELAHDEDIETVIDRVEQILAQALEQEELLPLLHLIQRLGGQGDWVDAFLACLFLANTGKISLAQEDFWGTLYLGKGEGPPKTAPVAAPGAEQVPVLHPVDGPSPIEIHSKLERKTKTSSPPKGKAGAAPKGKAASATKSRTAHQSRKKTSPPPDEPAAAH